MGRITTSVTVGNFSEPEHELRFDALIDTGAYCLTLPRAWRDRLGALPISRSVELETADHRVVSGEICGPVVIRIAGFDAIVGELLFVEMESEDGRYEPLVGYVTLEQSGIAVDVVHHRLLRVPHLDLKSVGPRIVAA